MPRSERQSSFLRPAPRVLALALLAHTLSVGAQTAGDDGSRAGPAILAQAARTQTVPASSGAWSMDWMGMTLPGAGPSAWRDGNTGRTGLRGGVGLQAPSSASAGIGALQPARAAGAWVDWGVTDRFTLQSSVRQVTAQDRSGTLLDLGARYAVPAGPNWRLGVAASLQFGDQRPAQDFSGLMPMSAGITGLRPHTGGAGLLQAGVGMGAAYSIDRRWTVMGGLNVSRLQGDPRDGGAQDRVQALGVLGLSYRY